MDKILIPVLIVAGIGLLAGIILAVASAIMAVPKDEKAEAILEVLPGANCGACGFSGCSGYAAALSKGEAQPGLCSPGGEACAKACAELLGTGDVAVEKKTALVHCMGSYDCTSDKMRYDGIDSCAASTLLAGGISSCRYGCMGMATAPPCANTAQSTSATAWRQSTPQSAAAAQNAPLHVRRDSSALCR